MGLLTGLALPAWFQFLYRDILSMSKHDANSDAASASDEAAPEQRGDSGQSEQVVSESAQAETPEVEIEPPMNNRRRRMMPNSKRLVTKRRN